MNTRHFESLTSRITAAATCSTRYAGVVVEDTEDIYSRTVVQIVIAVVMCYEHILTLSREIEYIWKGRLSGASFFFYIIRYCGLIAAATMSYDALIDKVTLRNPDLRYMTLMSAVPSLAWFMCSHIYRSEVIGFYIGSFAGFLVLIGAVVFAALRAYAVSGRNKWVFASVLILGLINPAAYLVICALSIAEGPLDLTIDVGVEIFFPGITLARICAVVADIVVLALIWRYMQPLATLRTSQTDLLRGNGNVMGGLAGVVIKNGILYFVALLVVNTTALVLGAGREYDLIYPNILGVIGLTCLLNTRFIMDLQEANAALCGMGTSLGGMSSLLITPGYEPLSFRRLSQIAPADFPGHNPEGVRVDPSASSAEV